MAIVQLGTATNQPKMHFLLISCQVSNTLAIVKLLNRPLRVRNIVLHSLVVFPILCSRFPSRMASYSFGFALSIQSLFIGAVIRKVFDHRSFKKGGEKKFLSPKKFHKKMIFLDSALVLKS